MDRYKVKTRGKTNSGRGNLPEVSNTPRRPLPSTATKPRQQSDLSKSIEDIQKQHNDFKANVRKDNTQKKLLEQINKWRDISIAHIRSVANQVSEQVKQQTNQTKDELNTSIAELAKELQLKEKLNIERCRELLQKCQHQLDQMSEIKINKTKLKNIPLITIENANTIKEDSDKAPPNKIVRFEDIRDQPDEPVRPPERRSPVIRQQKLVPPTTAVSPLKLSLYESAIFCGTRTDISKIQELFEYLKSLPPMDKNGAMSGNCDRETTQMESFLKQTFDFRNNRGEYIVQGVKSFQLGKSFISMDPNSVVYFPDENRNSFAMTIQEILQWQSSYEVYADKDIDGMSSKFLLKALEGKSKYGEEAFRMKFVARISQCPILMEFDAHIIPRQLERTWPHRIKLVSVTGVDFAGRMHDINDITTYVSNWQQIYELDPKSGHPLVFNGRDFRVKKNAPRGQLNEELLLKDLIRMARLRLRACDTEKVQIVVETGIGLGVFAGRHIGIDDTVRELSARAIRKVLEEDGASYKNILAVIFALPIFDGDIQDGRRRDVYHAFVNEFEKGKYKGCVPVMIADQDMHRLAVAIGKNRFVVSELNPADSHGVFGEYWQNRGPAVEEKLALTTLGLLVQHHLINPYVLDPAHYHLI